MDERLAQILLNSKKVMNKVETGDFAQGNIDRRAITASTDNSVPHATYNISEEYEIPQTPEVAIPKKLSESQYKSQVNNSRLPAAIKEAMLEKPIAQPDINFSNTLSLDFTEKVAKQMEKQGLKKPLPKVSPQPQKQTQQRQPIKEEEDFSRGNVNRGGSLNEAIINEMKPLIKEIIQSTLEATIEKVLMEKFAKAEKTQKINENLRIQVGDSVFVGKITGVKQTKK
jgi:hypothetical protein